MLRTLLSSTVDPVSGFYKVAVLSLFIFFQTHRLEKFYFTLKPLISTIHVACIWDTYGCLNIPRYHHLSWKGRASAFSLCLHCQKVLSIWLKPVLRVKWQVWGCRNKSLWESFCPKKINEKMWSLFKFFVADVLNEHLLGSFFSKITVRTGKWSPIFMISQL